MANFLTTTLLCFLLYLGLTTATGKLGVWNGGELVAGAIVSVFIAILMRPIVPRGWYRALSPIRLAIFFVYMVGPFFWSMAKANLDVVYRVISGRIKPGIVRISTGLHNDVSTTLLANSITLTPGTLTVEVDEKTNDLFIHWINVDEQVIKRKPRDCRPICGGFPEWARRIAG